MKNSRNRRWRLISDLKIQGQLLIRTAVYWVLCQMTMSGTILASCWMQRGKMEFQDQSVWTLLAPALVVSCLIMPLALFDATAFSNRFTGPLHNFRRHFANFVRSGTTDKVHFRRGDLLLELRDDFNLLCEQIDSEEKHEQRFADHQDHQELNTISSSIG